MRKEFLYWYPFDLRVSAKELVPNHLTFCIFQHAALFPPEQWPKAVGVMAC
jgi:leucyl-tRNA synthetase